MFQVPLWHSKRTTLDQAVFQAFQLRRVSTTILNPDVPSARSSSDLAMGNLCCGTGNQHYDGLVASLPSLSGKVIAVTGCTSGTGRIFARTCARKGAKVVMLNRSSHRADEAFQGLKDLAKESTAPEPLNIPCDLMSFKSVRSAAEKLQAELGQSGLDVLCNNAGIMGFGDKATEDGCDVQMQTNHLSHFLLTCLCMPLLEKAASLRGEARVVNHSSAARAMDGIENKLQEKYLGKNGGNLGGDSDTMFKGANFERYQQSKLANVVFTYALHDRLQKAGSKVKSLVAHPGVAATELAQGTVQAGGANDFGSAPKWIGSRMISFMGQSEEDATVGILRNACDPEAKSGEFYGPLGKGGATGTHDTTEYNGPVGLLKKEPLADEVAQNMLWVASEATTGIKFDVSKR